MFWVLDHWNGAHFNQVEDYCISWGRSWVNSPLRVATEYMEYTAPLRNLDYTVALRILDYTAPEPR